MNEGMGIIEKVVEWMLLYHAGLSYSKTAILINANYEAVRKWYRKSKNCLKNLWKQKQRKERIAVDGKEIRINGVRIWSNGFSKERRHAKENTQSIYRWGEMVSLDLQRLDSNRYTTIKFGPRGAIRRFFGKVEWRIRRFWNAFHEFHRKHVKLDRPAYNILLPPSCLYGGRL